jgi:hypothetical protein
MKILHNLRVYNYLENKPIRRNVRMWNSGDVILRAPNEVPSERGHGSGGIRIWDTDI